MKAAAKFPKSLKRKQSDAKDANPKKKQRVVTTDKGDDEDDNHANSRREN